MTATTHARLRRVAAEAVGSIPGIEAVLLFGSRARGSARQASDWDVAILFDPGLRAWIKAWCEEGRSISIAFDRGSEKAL